MHPSLFQTISFLTKALILFSMGTAFAAAPTGISAETELQSLSVRYASTKIEGEKEIEWSYAYFVGSKTPRLNRLNAWLRAQSIERLFQDQELIDQALKSKDSAVTQWLKSDEKASAAASQSATITPLRIFGKLLVLSAGNAYTADRQYIFSEVLVYDFEVGETIPLQSLFRDGAEEELNGLLAKSIKKQLSAERQSYNKCLKQKASGSSVTCVGDEINIDQCIESTRINWRNLEIIDSRHLRLEFPYRPWTHGACNYEFGFDISGSELEKLLTTPTTFGKAKDVPKIN